MCSVLGVSTMQCTVSHVKVVNEIRQYQIFNKKNVYTSFFIALY